MIRVFLIALLLIPFSSAVEFHAVLEPKVRKTISTQMEGILLICPLVGTRIIKNQALLSQAVNLLEAEGDQIKLSIASLKSEAEYYRKLSVKKQEQFKEGIINREELEAAKYELTKVSNRIKTYEVEFKKITLKISKSIIKSDIKGVVTRELKRKGEFVRSGEACIEIIDDTVLHAVFPIEYEKLQTFQGTHLTVLVNGQKYKVFHQSVSPEVDAASGMVQVKVSIDNHRLILRSGQKCLVQVTKGKAK